MPRWPRNVMIFSAAAAVLVGGSQWYYHNSKKNLNQALDLYGWKTPQQKQALQFIFRQANVEGLETSWYDKKTDVELKNTLLQIVQQTQTKLTNRTGTQERWEVKPNAWIHEINNTETHQKLLEAFRVLGFVDPRPLISSPDVVCVLGAAYRTMDLRANYLKALLQKGIRPKTLVFLVGERYVTLGVDGDEAFLNNLAQKFKKPRDKLTETDLMNDIIEQQSFAAFNVPMVVLDTPRGDLPRPTTQTTVLTFCDWLEKNPGVQQVTGVSNQPFLLYQRAVIEQTLKEAGQDIPLDIIGPGFKGEAGPATTQTLADALKGAIWAATPGVLQKLDLYDPNDPAYLAIYKQQPLIYHQKSNTPKP